MRVFINIPPLKLKVLKLLVAYVSINQKNLNLSLYLYLYKSLTILYELHFLFAIRNIIFLSI